MGGAAGAYGADQPGVFIGSFWLWESSDLLQSNFRMRNRGGKAHMLCG